jgi:membrane protein implicated in regulation of membrane protease activity
MEPHWAWFTLAAVLVIIEVVSPTFFFLWPGLAAGIVGFFALTWPDTGSVPRIVLFAILTLILALGWRTYLRRYPPIASDNPNLNQRGQQLIGQKAVVIEAIVNGRGRVRLGDSTWLCTGPDAPVDAVVEITGADGVVLTVTL